jgi:hypothetical protein
MIQTELELIVDRGEVTPFTDLPDILRSAMTDNPFYPDARTRVWRNIAVTLAFLGEVVGATHAEIEMRLPEQHFSVLHTGRSFLGRPDTETITLVRLYDGHVPTRYLIGRSSLTGEMFWTE